MQTSFLDSLLNVDVILILQAGELDPVSLVSVWDYKSTSLLSRPGPSPFLCLQCEAPDDSAVLRGAKTRFSYHPSSQGLELVQAVGGLSPIETIIPMHSCLLACQFKTDLKCLDRSASLVCFCGRSISTKAELVFDSVLRAGTNWQMTAVGFRKLPIAVLHPPSLLPPSAPINQGFVSTPSFSADV